MRRYAEWRGHPKLAVIIRRKIFGHDADDRPRLSIENDLPAEDVAVAAETALPQTLAQHANIRAAWLLIGWLQSPAEYRIHREYLKQTRRRHRHAQSLRRVAFAQIPLPAARSGHRHENVVLFLPIEKVGGRYCIACCAGCADRLLDGDDAIGVGIGQRPQKNTVDDAEDHGRARNPEHEGDECHDGKPEVLAQHAQSVTNIAQGCFQEDWLHA